MSKLSFCSQQLTLFENFQACVSFIIEVLCLATTLQLSLPNTTQLHTALND